MRAFSALALALSVPLAGGTLKPIEISRYWIESGMNKHILLEQISNAKCQSGPQYLESCKAAVEAARKQIENPVVLMTDDFEGAIEQVDQSKGLRESKEQVFGEMYNAFLRAFDPHAFLYPREAVKSMLSAESGSHYGTGIRVVATGAGLMVRDVYRNSPARASGLQVNDRIIKINGADLKEGLDSRDGIEWIAGKPGETVRFTVERQGGRRELNVPIGVINDPIITHDSFKVGKDGYGYVALNQFRDESCVQLRAEIDSFGDKIKGLILDLRYNPGGELDQGVCIAGLFAGKKDIVGTRATPVRIPVQVYSTNRSSTITWEKNFRDAAYEKMQLVVLIDAGSASASEIVSAALQDHKVAWIVGEHSFGKGTVQTVQDFAANSNFKIGFTNAVFFRPSGQANQLVGVTPDFPVPFRRGASEAERRSPREDDLFQNALKSPDSAPAGREPRPEAEALRQCVETEGRDLYAMSIVKKKIGFDDYQRAYALALLDCTNRPAQHNTSLAERESGKKSAADQRPE
jgi:carboxyl-terminal processing protease